MCISWCAGPARSRLPPRGLATLLVAALISPGPLAASESTLEQLSRLPRGYVCVRAGSPPEIDGRLDDAAWRTAPWSEPFVDIEGADRPAPPLLTRFKMLWDDEYLYVAADLEEPHVRARVRERDAVIHRLDGNFEIFMDPNGDSAKYVEIQVNAAGTIFDLLLPRPYRDGGYALFNWDAKGIRVGVDVAGTIDDPADVDDGWSVEVAIPWEPTVADFGHTTVPPESGDRWRMNFSRVRWPERVVDGRYVREEGARETDWVWSPQGVVDMHRPETWGIVEFRAANDGDPGTPVDPAQAARAMLYRLYHAQRHHHAGCSCWAAELASLGLTASGLRAAGEAVAGLAPGIGSPVPGSLQLAATESAFEARVEIDVGGLRQRWHIRQDGLLWRSR